VSFDIAGSVVRHCLPMDLASYNLRDVPGALWRRVVRKARLDGRSIRYILITLLEKYVKEGL